MFSDHAGLQRELALLERLVQKQFPTILPLRRRDGEFTSETARGRVLVYPFLTGSEPELNPQTAAAIGETLALLHAIEPPMPMPTPNLVNIQACADFLTQRESTPAGWSELMDTFARETEQLWPALHTPLPGGLVHGDVFPENTLFHGNTLQALIDFEQASTDHFLLDLGVAINGFCFPDNRLDSELTPACYVPTKRSGPCRQKKQSYFRPIFDLALWG